MFFAKMAYKRYTTTLTTDYCFFFLVGHKHEIIVAKRHTKQVQLDGIPCYFFVFCILFFKDSCVLSFCGRKETCVTSIVLLK